MTSLPGCKCVASGRSPGPGSARGQAGIWATEPCAGGVGEGPSCTPQPCASVSLHVGKQRVVILPPQLSYCEYPAYLRNTHKEGEVEESPRQKSAAWGHRRLSPCVTWSSPERRAGPCELGCAGTAQLQGHAGGRGGGRAAARAPAQRLHGDHCWPRLTNEAPGTHLPLHRLGNCLRK